MTAPTPNRVKQGELLENGLLLETGAELLEVTWDDVKFLFFGKIDPKAGKISKSVVPSDPQIAKNVFNLVTAPVGSIAQSFLSKKGRNASVPVAEDSFFLLDLYVKERGFAFRFEPRGTNFKKFLKEEAGLSGEINLFNFIKKLAPFIPNSLDVGVISFLDKGKNRVQAFSSLDEFTWMSHRKYLEATS